MSDSIVNFDLDGGTLDDISDLPSFGAFPTGAYLVNLAKGIEFKKINEHPAMTVEMALVSVEELKEESLDEGELPPKEGDIATAAFLMDNETGQGFYKRFADPIYKHLGVSRHREAIEQSKGLQLLVVMKRVHGKGARADQQYNQFVNTAVA